MTPSPSAVQELIAKWSSGSVRKACDNYQSGVRDNYCIHCGITEGPHDIKALLNEFAAIDRQPAKPGET